MKLRSRSMTPSLSNILALGALLGLAASSCRTVASEGAPASPTSEQGVTAATAPKDSSKKAVPASGANSNAEPTDLLGMLVANGTLTRSQFETLEELGEAAPPTVADEPSFTVGPEGLRFTSADGESSMKIGGRAQMDLNSHSNDAGLDSAIQDGTELRRARLELSGSLPEDVTWKAELDFANNATSIKDFSMGVERDDAPSVVIGHQKQPFSLGLEMSSNDIPFVERGVDNFLVVPFTDRAVGLRAQDSTENLFWAVGVFGNSVTPDSTIDDEGWGVTGRVVGTPVHGDGNVLHLGARGSYRMPDSGSMGVTIRDESTNMSNLRIVDTGLISNIDAVALYGGEAVYAHGPFSLGGEYNQVQLDRAGGDLDFGSWHVQATYSLTGESRADCYRIDEGEFKRLKANTPNGRPWELAARFATLDLNDGALSGGAEDALTLGLNCYYSDNVRFMFDWTNILSTEGGSATTQQAEGLNIFTVRAQLTF